MVTTAIFQTKVCNCKTVSYIATRHTSYLIGLLIFHMVVHCDAAKRLRCGGLTLLQIYRCMCQ